MKYKLECGKCNKSKKVDIFFFDSTFCFSLPFGWFYTERKDMLLCNKCTKKLIKVQNSFLGK